MEKHKVKVKIARKRLYLLPIVILVAAVGTYLLISTHAASCTVSSTLVNPCRPWLGAAVNDYPPGVGGSLKTEIANHEARIGRQLDVVHDYKTPGKVLSADDIYYATRANTYLMLNYKPAEPWINGDGGNATVNTQIDNMAKSIKALGSTKIFLSVHHEPENDVSANNCTSNAGTAHDGSPAQYVAMWHNVRTRFDALGVNNVVWVMNYMGFSKWNCLVPQMWPGNSYVDWVIWDPYTPGGGSTLNAAIGNLYTYLTNNSNSTNNYLSKPWGLNEWGADFSNPAQTYQAYADAKADIDNNTFPKLKLWDVWDNLGSKINYTTGGALDPAEQAAYNKFADDPHFTDSFYVTQHDTQPPQVNMTSPTNNANVSKTVSVSATATDNVAVAKVELYVDGGLKTSLTAAPYTYTWDTTKVANGSHTVYAIAYDTSGNTTTSSLVSVAVNNQVADSTPPAVSIVSPTSPATVKGTLSVSGTATDNVGVASVGLDVDGTTVATTNNSTNPYSLSLNTTKYADGKHSVVVQAYDAANNLGKSNTVSIDIANTVAPPAAPTGVTAKVVGPTQVSLSWAAVSNASVIGYYVERDGVVINQLAGTTYSDTAVSAKTSYSYAIVAYNSAGASSPSAAAKVTTPAPTDTVAPTEPTNVVANVVTQTQTNLSWSPSTDNVGVAGYYVLRDNIRIATVTNATSFGDASGTPGTSYTYAVRAFDAAGNRSALVAAPAVITQPAGLTEVSGLAATYYSNRALASVGINRTDSTVNFNWGASAPMSGIPANNFSVRWTGRIYAQTTGTYTLYTTTDDGARLSINGKLLINDWHNHSAKQNSATISMTAGKWYNIDLDYYEGAGLASAVLEWSGPGIPQNVIPSTALSAASYGLLGSYYQGTDLNNLVLNRTDNTIDFNWGSGSPDAQLPTDGFSVHWTGKVVAPATGVYTFYTNSDDGTRLSVGGAQIIDKWNDHGVREYSGSIKLTAGQAYSISMAYYENKLLASAQLLWSGPNITKQIVPSTVLLDR